MTLTPDFSEARRFLAILAPDGNAVFQTFDDDEDRKEAKLAWTTRAFDKLQGMNARRAGVFVTINEIEGDRRKAEYVKRTRCLFADFDGVDLPEVWPKEPSIIVNTSPGKWHAYWIAPDFPREEFADAQRAIAAYFGTDPKICDLPRVMRLPGFYHQKGEAFQVRIVKDDGPRYSAEEMRDWVASIRPKPEPVVSSPQRSRLNGSTDPYVKSAVERALSNLAAQTKGGRNDTLNSEAFGIFGLVKGGHVPETIREDMERIALSIGLAKSEIRATLKSAWEACSPRHPPEPRYARREELPPHDPETGEVREDEPDKPKREKPIRVSFGDMPFRMLGHNRGTYFYLPRGGGQIVELKSHEHTPLRLIALAPLNDWHRSRKDAEEGPITSYQWQQFANGMIHCQHQEGIFEEERVRGRGAWVDGRRTIVHTGSEVIVDGVTTPLEGISSRFIYEAASPWEFGFSDAATDAEAARLVNVCERLTWELKLSGALLAGWCVVAPVSGALRWRPHIWNTGSSGSGKTFVTDKIIGRMVGPAAERFEGNTTEAAIRQTLGHDARPVIIDEAESEDQEGIRRMQGVLNLARVSSSGGKISKGGSAHRAVTFTVRSCFCFSSIHTALKFQSDESRVTKLVLLPNMKADADAHYQALLRDVNAWFTPEYAARMFARSVKHMQTLLANCDTFTDAASIVLKSRRAADQIGPMLAGYHLCLSTKLVTPKQAEDFIRSKNWDDHISSIKGVSDEMRVFQFIMSRRVRTSHSEVTIGQALELIKDNAANVETQRIYANAIAPYGVKLDGGEIYISNTSQLLKEMFLKDAPQYANEWKRPLSQLPGAAKTAGGTRFAPGMNDRATVLPYGLLDGTFREREPGEDG